MSWLIMTFREPLVALLVLLTGSAGSFGCTSGDSERASEGQGGAAGERGTAGEGSGGRFDPGGNDTIDCRDDQDGKTTLVFVNRCVAAVTVQGSDIPERVIEPKSHACVDIGSDVEPLSSKRYWGFMGEDPGPSRHTLAEFTFNTDFNDFDWYNISHVDAHNIPMQIVPVARPDCVTLTCAEDWLSTCPAEGQYADSSGHVISCVSPERDEPQSPVVLFFEACDDAYAWSGDDQNGDDPSPMRACAGEDWDIVFCPEEKG